MIEISAISGDPSLGIEEALSDKGTMDSLAKKQAEREAADLEMLRNGEWHKVMMDALGEDTAGEEDLKDFCLYSIAGTALNNRFFKHNPLLHIFLTGDSGAGKTWTLMHCLPTLMPRGDYLLLTDLSAKGLDYYADEEGPECFRGKILFIDELADKDQTTRNKLKVVMNIGQDEVSNLTVDDKKRSKHQKFTAMPTIWTAAAEAIEDAERQFLNRPFILAPDSSENQTGLVHDMQKARSALGSFYIPESKKADALRLMSKIREEKDAEVLVLFSDYYRPDDENSRSMIPQFDSLVKSIAFAHRFDRPTATAPDGHKMIFATVEDGKEATRLWSKFIKHKITHVSETALNVLDLLNEVKTTSGQTTLDLGLIEDRGKLPEDVTVEYETRFKKLSLKSVKNALTALGKNGLAEYHECLDGKNRWIALSHPSQASQFVLNDNFRDGGKMLDKRILGLKTAFVPSSRGNKKVELPEDLKERVLGDLKLGMCPASLGEGDKEDPDQGQTVEGLKKLLATGKIGKRELEKIDPRQRTFIEKLIENGKIGINPSTGAYYWRG